MKALKNVSIDDSSRKMDQNSKTSLNGASNPISLVSRFNMINCQPKYLPTLIGLYALSHSADKSKGHPPIASKAQINIENTIGYYGYHTIFSVPAIDYNLAIPHPSHV